MKDSEIKHIALIPDGNRRWAKKRGLPTFAGHKAGADAVEKIANHLWDKGLPTFTLWGLSTDNVDKRSKEELDYLFNLIYEWVEKFQKSSEKRQTRMVHLGRKDRIPEKLANKILEVEEQTKNYKNHTFNLAIDYGGRDEIVRAFKRAEGKEVTIENFNDFLDTHDQKYPCPDLVIRTSGEQRTSGYLIWQAALSEIYFENSYLPDLTPGRLDAILEEVNARERRFGK